MNCYKPLFSFLIRKVVRNDSELSDCLYVKYEDCSKKQYDETVNLNICDTKNKHLVKENRKLEDKIEELEEKLEIIDNLSFSMEEYFKYLKPEEKSKFILKLLKIKNADNVKDANISINYGEICTYVTYID